MNLGNINLGSPVNWGSPLNKGLISWWLPLPNNKGGGTLFDLCSRYNGTLTNMNAVTDWVPGRVSGIGALNFDGNNDAVNTTLELTSLGSMGTVLVSVFPTNAAASGVKEFLCGCQLNSNNLFHVQHHSSNFLYAGWVVGGVDSRAFVAASSTTWSQNEWQQYALVYSNGSNALLYRNGVQIASGGTAAGLTSSAGLQLGAHTANEATASWTGRLSDSRFWNRSLSASDLAQVYHDSLTGYQQTLQRKVWLARTSAPAAPAGGANHHFLPLLGAA